jgi:hypothetical protein
LHVAQGFERMLLTPTVVRTGPVDGSAARHDHGRRSRSSSAAPWPCQATAFVGKRPHERRSEGPVPRVRRNRKGRLRAGKYTGREEGRARRDGLTRRGLHVEGRRGHREKTRPADPRATLPGARAPRISRTAHLPRRTPGLEPRWNSDPVRRYRSPGRALPSPDPTLWSTSLLSHDAGWSSLVARRAHNPKAAGSNPAPATSRKPGYCEGLREIKRTTEEPSAPDYVMLEPRRPEYISATALSVERVVTSPVQYPKM